MPRWTVCWTRWEGSCSGWPSSSEAVLGPGVQAQQDRAVAGEAVGREGWWRARSCAQHLLWSRGGLCTVRCCIKLGHHTLEEKEEILGRSESLHLAKVASGPDGWRATLPSG